MKKTIALSLTLALAGAFTCLGSDIVPKNYESVNAYVTETEDTTESTQEYDLTKNDSRGVNRIGNPNTEKTIDDTPTSKNSANTTNVNRNVKNENENSVNGLNTQNIYTNNQGSSPYGIHNGNSGVLPNTNNTQNSNIDSMVRTNNIDTYKNNSVTNIDGKTYNNDGGVVSNNQNSASNNPNVNKTNMTAPNRNNTNSTKTDNTDSIARSDTPSYSLSNTQNRQNNSQSEVKTNYGYNEKTNFPTTSNTRKTTYSDSSITQLNASLSSLNREMNDKMELARENIGKIADNTLELDDDKIDLINAYSRVVHCLSIKLAENHFELMRSAGRLALLQSELESDAELSPAYLDLSCTLRTREVCLQCLINALDELNSVFGETDTDSNETRSARVTATSAKPETKEYHLNNESHGEAHSTPRAKFI